MEKRKILLFVKTRNSKRNHEIEGYISADSPMLEAKGFFNYFDEEENIHIIPAENIEYFALSYSLVEYAEMEGFTDSKASTNLINNTYTLDTNQDKVMDIEDCFSVAKGTKYIAFDTFGTEVVNRIFVPISSVKDITIRDNEAPTRYKASLLFDPTVLLAAAGEGNDHRVLDIFKNLKPTGITEAEVVQLYQAGFYDLTILPEGIANGLDVYINHSEEIDDNDEGNIIRFHKGEDGFFTAPEGALEPVKEDTEEVQTPSDNVYETIEGDIVDLGTEADNMETCQPEEPDFSENLAESHPDAYAEVQEEFKRDLNRLKAFSKYRLQQELANDHLIKANNPNYTSTLLDIEEAYYDILKSTGTDITKDSHSFKENLVDYIRSM
jgi:hypothetical protein|nr:MAG TPA: hypothetical protein [Caudoviricetes sp.]